MATLAQALNGVAGMLIPLLNVISARPDPQSQADASSLTHIINLLLTDAMQANAQDVESKLANDATALLRLTKFTAEAEAKAATLAASQANVAKFVSLATHVGNVLISAASGNIGGCSKALLESCGDLGITTA